MHRPDLSAAPLSVAVQHPAAPTPRDYGVVEFVVAADSQKAVDVWIDCRDKWLNSLQRRSGWTNTRRAYEHDWNEFFAAFRNIELMPWTVASLHAEQWIDQLYAAGLSDATVNRKLAALSSFYQYASYNYTLMGPGGERSLWEHPNPFRKASRVKTTPYGHAKFPSAEQVTLLLGQIDLATVQGWRDMAILLGLFATTRRVSEWTGLRWGDIHDADDGGKWFEYRYKGGTPKKQAIPAGLWKVVDKYLHTSGRWPLAADDYLFIATKDTARRFRNAAGRPTVSATYDPDDQPISNHRVNDLLKRYGRRVGIPDDRLHAHGLRHAGARLRRHNGADIMELKDLLGHANLAITQVYVQDLLDEPEDAAGESIVSQIMPRQLKFAL